MVNRGGRKLKAVIPGGSSVPVVPGDAMLTVNMDYDSLKKVGSAIGSPARIVMDQSTDLIRAIARLAYFYKHESCGQCTPCREGSGWMWRVLERMAKGEAEHSEIDLLLEVTTQVEGHTICALGDAAAWPIQGLIRHFRGDIPCRPHKQAGVHCAMPDGSVCTHYDPVSSNILIIKLGAVGRSTSWPTPCTGCPAAEELAQIRTLPEGLGCRRGNRQLAGRLTSAAKALVVCLPRGRLAPSLHRGGRAPP